MQRLEVSGAVRDIYIYIYDVSRLRVKIFFFNLTKEREIFPCNFKNCLVRIYGEFTKPNMSCRKRRLCKNEVRFSGKK
jgi:hypothetical protein